MSAKFCGPYVVGIDASNIRQGGGITHLLELLNEVDPDEGNIKKVIIWGCEGLINQIPPKPWLVRVSPSSLNKSLMMRIIWQVLLLKKCAKKEGCSILFIPGGIFLATFFPAITMCQNMLPFTLREVSRLPLSLARFRLVLLRLVQSFSFKRSNGVIFLTKGSLDEVISSVGPLDVPKAVVPHGLSNKFLLKPRQQLSIENFSKQNPYIVGYVSSVAPYKHQKEVVEAIKILRLKGYPVSLKIVGPGIDSYYFNELGRLIEKCNDPVSYIDYLGPLEYKEIEKFYAEINLAVFASTCEAQAIILIEKMAAGLPIACSNRSSMSEVLGEAGIYFDAENPSDIAEAMEKYIESPELRANNIQMGLNLVKKFNWRSTANLTFKFIENCLKAYENRIN